MPFLLHSNSFLIIGRTRTYSQCPPTVGNATQGRCVPGTLKKMPRRIGGGWERTAGIPRRAASWSCSQMKVLHTKRPRQLTYATGQGYLCTRQQRKSGGSDPPLPKSQSQTRKCVPADSAHGWPADYAALARSMCSRRKAAVRTGGLLWGLPKRFPARPTPWARRGSARSAFSDNSCR